MRKALKSLLALGVLAAAFQAGAWYYERTGVAASQVGPDVLHYACPMHPGHKSDRPGDCGACGMRLEPVHADGAVRAPGRELPPEVISVSARQQQLIGVETETVGVSGAAQALRLTGRVVPDERLEYTLNAGLEGTIKEVSSVTTGSLVRRNQVLATYTAPDFLLAIQSYILALDALDKIKAGRERDAAARAAKGEGAQEGEGDGDAKAPRGPEPGLPPIITRGETGLVVNSGSSNFQQRIDRLQLLGMSDMQIEEIRRMRDVPYSIKIVAPADGTVLSRKVKPGYKFARGEEWFRIADLSRVWVVVDVPNADIEHMRPGKRLPVRIPGLDKTLMAHVADIAPQFDVATSTFKVRLEADNPGGILRPDMFVDVESQTTLPSSTVSVPAEAVIDTGMKKTVYVESEPGVFEPREVETGWRRGGRVQIVRGISHGDRIVSSGTFLLDSESRMRSAAVHIAALSEAKDPICGMDVDISDAKAAALVSDHEGMSRYFCSRDCKDRFDESR
jgi:Cu(I)/Ag(I) efflux system membrane fusion protein